MAESVEDICTRLVKDSKLVASCNGFLAAVANKVESEHKVEGVSALFAGTADSVRGRFADEARTVKPLVFIGQDPDKATAMAAAGHFVVGGLTSGEMTYVGRDKVQRTATMGHVVVVVPGGPSKPRVVRLANGKDQPARGGYPYCYQGAAHAIYRFSERTQVDVVFPSLLLDRVIYAYVPLK
jgi:hypothetical protein